MDGDEDPTTEELLAQQEAREERERLRAEATESEDEELAATRRADKAAYLQEKLAEQAEHPDEPEDPT